MIFFHLSSLPKPTRLLLPSCSRCWLLPPNSTPPTPPPPSSLITVEDHAGLKHLFRDRKAFDAGNHPSLTSLGHRHRPVQITYQGVWGSYCQEAATEAYPFSSHPPFLPCPQMEVAFTALEDGSADRAIIHIENSLDGPVPRNLDLLLRHPKVHIVGKLLPIKHCLLSLPGAC